MHLSDIHAADDHLLQSWGHSNMHIIVVWVIGTRKFDGNFVASLPGTFDLAEISWLISWWSFVGGKMVQYVNHLQRLNWWPEHAITIILKSAMNLTCKNQGFHYDTRGRIKSWNLRSAPNVVVHILKNQVNSYDSNGVIAVPISTLGDEKRNLPFSVYLFFLGISWTYRVILYVVGKIFSRGTQRRWNHEKRFRIDGDILEISFMNLSLRGENEVWTLN